MLKKYSTLLGIGLLFLWMTGLGSADAPSWMTWWVGLAALCAFGIAAFTPSYASKNAKSGEAVMLSAGLFLVWIASLLNAGSPWFAWWTFAFACAFLLLGIGVGLAPEKSPPTVEPSVQDRQDRLEEEKRRFRRGA